MKTLLNFITEALNGKFSNFSKEELDVFKQELEDTLKNDEKVLSQYNKKTRDIYIGNKYLVRFKNPFIDDTKYSSTPNKITKIKDDNDDIITAIGVGDKFGNIHLVNIWEEDKVTIKYERSASVRSKFGGIYNIPSGWKLTRKDFEYYKVNKDKASSKTSKFYNELIEVQFVLQMTDNYPKQIEQIQKDIINDMKDKEYDEKYQIACDEFFKNKKSFKDLGEAWAWNKVPDDVMKAIKEKNDWFVSGIQYKEKDPYADIRRTLSEYYLFNIEEKVYFRVSSTIFFELKDKRHV